MKPHNRIARYFPESIHTNDLARREAVVDSLGRFIKTAVQTIRSEGNGYDGWLQPSDCYHRPQGEGGLNR